MKALHSCHRILLILATLFASATAQAATKVEDVSLSFTNFVYDSNFWEGRPSATVGGAAPVSRIDLNFTLTYITPVDEAFDFGIRTPEVSNLTASLVGVDIPGFSQASRVITGTQARMSVFRRFLSTGEAYYGLSGRVLIADSVESNINNPLLNMSFLIPNFFSGQSLLGTESASYNYNSPKPFDSPKYRMSSSGGSELTIQRSVQSFQASPVPLPATLLLGLGSLLALAGVRCFRHQP